MKKRLLFLFLFVSFAIPSRAQNLYFPPAPPQAWDSLSPSTLNWCQSRIDSLYDFLDQKHTKSFIILKDGKIVLEKYFGIFTQDSLWYWASCGKTLTAMLIGIAQEQGILNINDSVSSHIGNGWSSCSTAQEDAITIKHLLKMTSGLDDNNPPCSNEDDTPGCLQYLAPPDTRWAYQTGAYRKLQDIIPLASNSTLNAFTTQNIKNKINMGSGFWLQDVYYSKTRDAARFGLLCLNKGIWDTDTVLGDTAYFQQMTSSSQNYNPSYGYLTWLNGQSNFMLPSTQLVFNGYICPNAPADMYAALGKNDQKIYVVPSQNMVVVRFGDAAYSSALSLSVFDDELWQKINELECTVTSTKDNFDKMSSGPNPFHDVIYFSNAPANTQYTLLNNNGTIIYYGNDISNQNFESLPVGLYLLQVVSGNAISNLKMIKN